MNNQQKEGEPAVIKEYILDIQVCVPKTFSDDQVLQFANKQNPSGTSSGWLITRKGDRALNGSDERMQCSQHGSHCHIMLHC